MQQTQTYHTATVTVSDVNNDIDCGRPRLELFLPCDNGRERDNDEERTVDVVRVHEHGQERDGLDGLSETHLIGENCTVVSINNEMTK